MLIGAFKVGCPQWTGGISIVTFDTARNSKLRIVAQNFSLLQVALGEVESERDNLLEMKEKMQSTQRGLSESEERETLLLKDMEDLKAKHAFAQAEFEQERDELNDVVTKSKLLLQVLFYVI